MSLEAASNNNNRHRERDVFRDRSTPEDGDSQPLSNVFSHAFGQTTFPLSNSMSTEASASLDDFEATVLTSCLLTSVVPVVVPADFEQQVLARIQSGKTVPADVPKPLHSPFQQNPSRELFRRYRKLIQVALPLLLASGIALAMYISSTKSEEKEQEITSPTPLLFESNPPSLDIRIPANEEFMQFKPKPTKKRPYRSKINVIRGA